MLKQRLQFDEHTTKNSQSHVSQVSLITQLVMKLPGIRTRAQASFVLLIVTILSIILTLYFLATIDEDSYYIPPEAFQEQMLDE